LPPFSHEVEQILKPQRHKVHKEFSLPITIFVPFVSLWFISDRQCLRRSGDWNNGCVKVMVWTQQLEFDGDLKTQHGARVG
jgi:hypothetical protein